MPSLIQLVEKELKIPKKRLIEEGVKHFLELELSSYEINGAHSLFLGNRSFLFPPIPYGHSKDSDPIPPYSLPPHPLGDLNECNALIPINKPPLHK